MEMINYKGIELLPPGKDMVFKALFGGEDGKELLAAFLRDVLGIDVAGPEDIVILNSEMPVEYERGKPSYLDIRVRTKDNRHINIEIQLQNEDDIIARSVLYNAKLFTSQLEKRQPYSSLGQALSLFILDFTLLNETDLWYNQYRLKNLETGQELTDLMEIVFLELPKVRKQCPWQEKLSSREKWSLFLSTRSGEVLEMLAKQNPEIGAAVEKLLYVSADEKMRVALELRDKAERDYYSGLATAKARGHQQGLEQGAAQEREKMAVEMKQEREKMAVAMKQEGIGDDAIARLTGLPINVVQKL